MAAENSSHPEPEGSSAPDPAPNAVVGSYDEAIDAIVYDVHPALLPPVRKLPDASAYPYGPRAPHGAFPAGESLSAGAKVAGDVMHWITRTVADYIAVINRPPDFVVPKTFGMSAILGIMTALAILFGCLRWMNAWPVFYFFFGAQSLAICLVQMFYGQTPRLASIIAGSIFLPVFTIAAAVLSNHSDPALACAVVAFIPCGALLGYLTGTCAAGIFLVMDYLEPYLQGQSPLATHPSSPAHSP
jgi:hypothetical protein